MILPQNQAKCPEIAWALKNIEWNSRPDEDQRPTCKYLQTDFTCKTKMENETEAQFMPNDSEQAGGTASIECRFGAVSYLC